MRYRDSGLVHRPTAVSQKIIFKSQANASMRGTCRLRIIDVFGCKQAIENKRDFSF